MAGKRSGNTSNLDENNPKDDEITSKPGTAGVGVGAEAEAGVGAEAEAFDNLAHGFSPSSLSLNPDYSPELRDAIQGMEKLVFFIKEERNQPRYRSEQRYADACTNLNDKLNLAKLQKDQLKLLKEFHCEIKESEKQRNELAEYRVNSEKALKIKDDVITELKSGAAANKDGEGNLLQMELDALKQVHANTLEECTSLRKESVELRRKWELLTDKHLNDKINATVTENALREELRKERQLLKEAEMYLLTQGKELVGWRNLIGGQF